MSLPWYVPLEKAPSLKDADINEQPSLLKHYSNLKIHESPIEEIQSGLMCDIGMMNRDVTVIQRLIACGMTIAKLELVGLESDDCAQLIQSIRQAVYNYSTDLNYIYPLALLMSIQGPTIETGELKDGPKSVIEIHKNKTIRLSTEPRWKNSGTCECLYVRYDHLTKLHPSDKIFIDSVAPGEKIQLSVLEVGECSVECRVNIGGLIGSKMAVRIPKVPEHCHSINDEGDSTSIYTITSNESSEKPIEQKDQIAWAVASDIDALLIPRCQYSSDVRLFKELLSENGKHILIFASVETVRGLDNIDDILKEADGIFLDRNNLSTDLPIEKIFIAQKMILAKCNLIGKPCICKAVINEHIPTLCVSDIANLIIDGADVIYLELNFSDSPLKKLRPSHDSNRIATHCLAAASVICKEAEHILWKPSIYGNLELMQSPLNEPSKGICVSAVELAMRSRASVILCMTNSGRTAKILSYVKPPCPIVAVTRTCHAARQLRFWRGVRAVHCFDEVKSNWNSEVEARILVAIDYCKAKRILCAGDPYVVVTGTRRGVGYCDSIRLLYASARNMVIVE
ncbi:unnamed protein product [Diatraea saccharalis]|uniref:Pyruvate kinase n=1 Tax=Diatraea saccharalis TaxID=40085 RepID=A0A9N9RFZ7_9NEOP|nr:unnamed protein product [Diatraea saccharalis]